MAVGSHLLLALVLCYLLLPALPQIGHNYPPFKQHYIIREPATGVKAVCGLSACSLGIFGPTNRLKV
jgi:hypothetical protein